MRGRQPIVAAVLAAITMLLGTLGGFRGLNLWSLWLVDGAERFSHWRETGTPEALQAAFADGNGLMYGAPYIASLLGGGDAVFGARFAAVLASGLVAWLVYVWGARMSGPRGGVASVVFLWCVPRFWAAVTVASPSIFMLAGTLLLWRMVMLTRDDPRWFGPAAFLGGAALALGLPVWLTLLPLAWLVLVKPETLRAGLVGIRSTSVFTLALPLVCAAVFVALAPWLHHDSAERAVEMMGVWVERPAEPFLVQGVRWGQARMWPWTPVLLLFVTTPAPLWLAGLGLPLLRLRGTPTKANSRGWNDADVRQEWVAFALWGIILPVLLRSVFHGGADLLLLLSVACVLAAGTVVSAAVRITADLLAGVVTRGGVAAPAEGGVVSSHHRLAMFAMWLGVLAVISAADVSRCDGVWEAYRSGVVGGTHGATLRGYSRYPHGPVPIAPLRLAVNSGARRFAVLANAWEVRPVMQRYATLGLLPPDTAVVSLGEADAIVISFDDTLPELYDVASDWALMASSSPERIYRTEVDGVTVFAVGRLP